MKTTVLGYQQKRVVELDLKPKDLFILQWFVDFSQSGKIQEVADEGALWSLVNYKDVIADYPSLKINNKRVVSRHFDKLVKSGLLNKKISKNEGNKTFFSLVKSEYEKLLDYPEVSCPSN